MHSKTSTLLPNDILEDCEYDSLNQLDSVTRTIYDDYGRAVITTDSYLEGTSQPITGSQTLYDDLGRATTSRRLSDLLIVLEDGETTLSSSGVLVSQTQTTFDSDGRVAVTTNAYGLETHTLYDWLGRVTETRREAIDETGSTVWLVSRTTYDSLGRVDVSTDTYLEGQTTIYGNRTEYDVQGRAVKSIRLEGIDISLDATTGDATLNSAGTTLYATETVYDFEGRVFQQIGPEGQVTEYEYDAFDRQVAMLGPAVVIDGVSVRLRSETLYDAQGRAVVQRTNIRQFADNTIDDSDVQTTTHEFDSRGNILKTTYADSTFIQMTYDDRGRKLTETNQMGLTRSFGYDSQGRLASVTLPDLDGNPATTNDIATYSYGYDARGNQILLVDPLGRETRWTFDDLGRETSRTLPLGFGADGMAGTADDGTLPEGDFTEHTEYDSRGRVSLQTSFEGVITQFVYDDSFHGTGRLSQKKFYASEAAFNAGTVSETQTMTLDAFGREVSVVWDRDVTNPGTTVDTWTNEFDLQGRLIRVSSPTGDINYEYDVFARQTRVFTGSSGTYEGDQADPSSDIRYSYDDLGRLAKVETFERNDVVVDVDSVTAGDQPETESYAYDLLGNLDYEINPDGSTTDYSYDDLNRLTDIDEYRADANTPADFTDNPKLSEYSYTLRADGKREFADEILYDTDGTTEISHTQFDWTYDNAGRLTDEVFTDVDDLLTDVDNYHTSFEYDLTGNRLSQTTITDDDGTAGFNAATDTDKVVAYTQDANDRMLSESTVIDGTATESTAYGYTGTQQTAKVVTPGGSGSPLSAVSFTYDLQGRMFQATTETFNAGTLSGRTRATYQYGTDGIRFHATEEIDTVLDLNTENWQLKTDTKYLVDANNHTGYQQVLEETVTDENGDLAKKIVYTIGHDHISQTTFTPAGDAQGTTAVFHMDGHGSTRVLTDLAGTILNIAGVNQIFHYTAYGESINFDRSLAGTTHQFSGEQHDAATGLDYLRARSYDSRNGNFIGLDRFFGNKSDPQSFHKYLYTHADPVNGVDPTGNMSLSMSIAVTIGVGITFASFPNVANAPDVYDQTIPDSSDDLIAAMMWEMGFSVAWTKGISPVGRWVLGKIFSKAGSTSAGRWMTATFANSARSLWKMKASARDAVGRNINSWLKLYVKAGGKLRVDDDAFRLIKQELLSTGDIEAATLFENTAQRIKNMATVKGADGKPAFGIIRAGEEAIDIGPGGGLGTLHEELNHFYDLSNLADAADNALTVEHQNFLRFVHVKIGRQPFWGRNVNNLGPLTAKEQEIFRDAVEGAKDHYMSTLFDRIE